MKKIVICVIIGLSGIFFIAETKAQTAPGEVTGQMRKFSCAIHSGLLSKVNGSKQENFRKMA